MARSRLYVDRRQSTLSEAGEFLIPTREGVIGDDHIVSELGEVLEGKAPGRGSAAEITLFKSLAIADLAAALYIWRKAEATGAGVWVEIGGKHYGSM
jgi:ornithine cyclodeaminase/alanine dehydrogenase-like protein (mu-crystallin family)